MSTETTLQHGFISGKIINKITKEREKEGTHRRDQELLHLLHGSPHLDLGPRLRVLHRDENVQVLVQVLPVRLPSVLLLLKRRGKEVRGKAGDVT